MFIIYTKKNNIYVCNSFIAVAGQRHYTHWLIAVFVFPQLWRVPGTRLSSKNHYMFSWHCYAFPTTFQNPKMNTNNESAAKPVISLLESPSQSGGQAMPPLSPLVGDSSLARAIAAAEAAARGAPSTTCSSTDPQRSPPLRAVGEVRARSPSPATVYRPVQSWSPGSVPAGPNPLHM